MPRKAFRFHADATGQFSIYRSFVADDQPPTGPPLHGPHRHGSRASRLRTQSTLARRAAAHAYVPESDFPVGCVLLAEDGRLVPGCNVEHGDWTRGLCAERTALATAAAYGVGPVRRIFLSCPTDPGGTPCGACRQLLAEHVPGVPIVMDRGEAPPARTTPEHLLPDFFSGDRLRL